MYSAFAFLNKYFRDLAIAIRIPKPVKIGSQVEEHPRPLPSRSIREIEYQLERLEDLYARWPSSENPIYLENAGKYVWTPGNAAVYLIRRVDTDSMRSTLSGFGGAVFLPSENSYEEARCDGLSMG